MSVLEKIREKSGLLIVVIGAALVLFLLGDLLMGGQALFSSDVNSIGEVAGQSISGQEYDAKLREAEDNYVRRSGQPLDDATAEMLRQQTFEQIVKERIMKEQYQELGLIVSDQELYDMVNGEEPHALVRQAFTNPQTGAFDRAVIGRYLQNLEADETGEAMREWLAFEKQLREIRLDEKYNNLIKKGLYIPDFLAKHDFIAKNKTATFNYVAKRYATVSDSTIAVSEDELNDYYEKHKDEYEQEASRTLNYVVFEVAPSNEDIAEGMAEANEIKEEFRNAENDTMFVFQNSDQPSVPATYSFAQLPPDIDSAFFYSERGTIKGPSRSVDGIVIHKLSNVVFQPDSAHARHILIKIVEGDTAAAMAKVDSIKQLITRKKNFEEVAKVESEDFGSATKGGDLGWFTPGTMVKPFNDAVFEGNIGDLAVVNSQFGIHLIEVLEKSAPVRKVEIASVIIPLEPGSETKDLVYSRANDFLIAAKDEEAFESSAKANSVNVLVADNLRQADRNMKDLENSRPIVKWAYEAEEGDVSQVYDLGNRFVVAMLTDSREKGYATLEDIRAQIEIEVRKEKKAEQFIEEFRKAGGTDLNAVASSTGLPVESAANATFAAYSIPGLGREPAVAGTAFGLKPNVLSQPVKGETGVFVLAVQQVTEATIPQDLSQSRSQLAGMLGNRVSFEVFEALKKKAEVIDNLGKFD